jgi:hypothetical protein
MMSLACRRVAAAVELAYKRNTRLRVAWRSHLHSETKWSHKTHKLVSLFLSLSHTHTHNTFMLAARKSCTIHRFSQEQHNTVTHIHTHNTVTHIHTYTQHDTCMPWHGKHLLHEGALLRLAKEAGIAKRFHVVKHIRNPRWGMCACSMHIASHGMVRITRLSHATTESWLSFSLSHTHSAQNWHARGLGHMYGIRHSLSDE